jgi:hypothetical protein
MSVNGGHHNRETGESRLHALHFPITLGEVGFSWFYVIGHSVWAVFLFILWLLNVELNVSAQTAAAIASSSVGLAGLSLALLSLLHGLKLADRWFSLGLLTVALSFAGVAFTGFVQLMMWSPESAVHTVRFSNLQLGIAVLLGLFAAGILTHAAFLNLPFVEDFANWKTAVRRKIALELPLAVFVFVGLSFNFLAAVVVLFFGALSALVSLALAMAYQVAMGVESKTEARKRSVGESILRYLRLAQDDARKQAQPDSSTPVMMLNRQELLIRLRQENDDLRSREIYEALETLLDHDLVFSPVGARGLIWLEPEAAILVECESIYRDSPFILVEEDVKQAEQNGIPIADYVSQRVGVPKEVVKEFAAPRILKVLEDLFEQTNFQVNTSNVYKPTLAFRLYVNKEWKNSGRVFTVEVKKLKDICDKWVTAKKTVTLADELQSLSLFSGRRAIVEAEQLDIADKGKFTKLFLDAFQ